MRCDASNRLLRNTSHDLLGGFRVVSRVMSYGTFQNLSENTCSEYRIPPQNTPEVANSKLFKKAESGRLIKINYTATLM